MASVTGWVAPSALAGWRPSANSRASIAYNQGASFDPRLGDFFFDGVSSTTNSGLYRTTSRLVQTAANTAVIPLTPEGYNHAGDLSFDAVARRVLLPLECYYPAAGGNTCQIGAIGVADPVTLQFRYYVNLDAAQIKKAMWVEISPDGRWIWTSSGTHLLAYRAARVSGATAAGQRAGRIGGLVGKDLGSVLPSSGVTGGAIYEDALTPTDRLLLALNRGTYSELISYSIGSARDGSPTLLRAGPTSELKVAKSALTEEPEGLAVTGAGLPVNPLGGVLHWLFLPKITPSSVFAEILSYRPVPAPPRDGARVTRAQRIRAVLRRGLTVSVVCNARCTSTASATIDGKLARGLGLAPSKGKLGPYTVGVGALAAGRGPRTLKIIFRARPRHRLERSRRLKLAVIVRSRDLFSHRRVTDKLLLTLTR